MTTMSAENISDHVRQQLRLIRAENAKRDRDLALMRADFTLFRSQLVGVTNDLQTIISILGTHTDTLHEMNDRLLTLERQHEGEP